MVKSKTLPAPMTLNYVLNVATTSSDSKGTSQVTLRALSRYNYVVHFGRAGAIPLYIMSVQVVDGSRAL